jgi:hypothetical protein
MITDKITKKDFIVKTLRRDMTNIYDTMTLIARQNIYHSGRNLTVTRREGPTIGRRTGSLLDSLESRDFELAFDDDRFLVTARFVKYLRFFDMKHLGNWKIYNRQVWGILYNNAIPDIKYNLGSEVTDAVGDSLRQAFGVYLAGQRPNSPAAPGVDPHEYAKRKGRE